LILYTQYTTKKMHKIVLFLISNLATLKENRNYDFKTVCVCVSFFLREEKKKV
jgi:hypothetical protein